MTSKNTYLNYAQQAQDRLFEAKLALREKRHSRRLKQMEGKSVGRWTPEESAKYYAFLLVNQTLIEKRKIRKSDRVFKLMSKFIISRSSEQCRSHHQKIERKWSDFSTILHNLSLQLRDINIDSIVEQNKSLLISMSQQTTNDNFKTSNEFQRLELIKSSKQIQKIFLRDEQMIINVELKQQLEIPLLNLTLTRNDEFFDQGNEFNFIEL